MASLSSSLESTIMSKSENVPSEFDVMNDTPCSSTASFPVRKNEVYSLRIPWTDGQPGYETTMVSGVTYSIADALPVN